MRHSAGCSLVSGRPSSFWQRPTPRRMPSNKNQHFVPRCYLRSFTLDGASAAINVFNVVRSLFIENAAVKNQCSRNYFYGADQNLERALQSMEGAYAQGLSEILRPSYFLNDTHRELLRRFWLLQHLRTEAVSLRAVEMSAGMEAVIGARIEGFRPTAREAVQMAMRIFAEAIDIVDDLKICLLRNRTAIPFLTSDDPAVMTNRWYMEDPRTTWRSPGLQSAGALLLLPLTPRVLCLAYDGDVYSIPNAGGWVEVKRERDIQAFNQHQFFNCHVNIYFRDWDHRQQIQHDFNAVASIRPTARHRFNYATFDRAEGGAERYQVVARAAAGDHDRALIHTETVSARPSSWPMQITRRVRGVAYTNGTGLGFVRRHSMHRLRGDGFRKIRTG
jgi:hypothetical protein